MAIDTMTMLLAELNMRNAPDIRKAQLQTLLDVAAERIRSKGIQTLDPLNCVSDAQLQVDFAAYLYRRRTMAEAVGIPRGLQLDIHDRLVAEKARVTNG